MSNDLKVFHSDSHYVVTIKVEKVAREFVARSYSSQPEASSVSRVVEDVHSLTFKKSTLNDAVTQAIGHLNLMKESNE